MTDAVPSVPAALRPREASALDLALLSGDPTHAGVTVHGAALDSRLVQPGDLYIALPGARTHGAAHVGGAVGRGAVAVLTDAAGAEQITADLPVVVDADPRAAMAGWCARIYGHPTDRLTMLAVTGTNGKTTTAFLLEAGLRAAGVTPGVIGTIGYRLDGQALPSARTTITTPESPDLQALLAVMAERGAGAVAMEVSSIALDQRRVDGIRFAAAGFTNLGRDHLDYHETMERYYLAKRALFTAAQTDVAVVNIDDEYGRRLATEVAAAGGATLLTTSLHQTADFQVSDFTLASSGLTQVALSTPAGPLSFDLGLPGDYNVHNAVTALAMLYGAGLPLDSAASGFAEAAVPGRLQQVRLDGAAPIVYVDFAHTPQAVTAALGAVRDAARVIAVLGCGGDRDALKRGPMGAAAAGGADVVIVTDDNPRSEVPSSIRAAVLAGARDAVTAAATDDPSASTEVIDGGERREAIALALRLARHGDVVALLGKGHETGQEIGDNVLPFSDVDVVAEEWARLSRPRGT